MKNKRLIFYISLVFVFFLGYLIGITIKGNELDSLQIENDNLRAALITSEEEIKILQERPKTQLVYKEFQIDGFIRNNSELVTAIEYNEELYVPLYFLSTERGEVVKEYDDLVVIGEPLVYEKLLGIDAVADLTDLDKLLGKPYSSKTYESVCSMNETTMKEYDGVTINGDSIQVDKPVLQTYRRITVGSTREEVEKAYGKPNPIDSDLDHYRYGPYYANLWFHFEEGKVKNFGIVISDC